MDNMDALKKKRVLHGHIRSRPTNFIQYHCTFFDHRHSLSKLDARFDHRKIKHAQDKDFIDNSARPNLRHSNALADRNPN